MLAELRTRLTLELQEISEVISSNLVILQMVKLRFRKVKLPVQGHISKKWQGRDPSLLISSPTLIPQWAGSEMTVPMALLPWVASNGKKMGISRPRSEGRSSLLGKASKEGRQYRVGMKIGSLLGAIPSGSRIW